MKRELILMLLITTKKRHWLLQRKKVRKKSQFWTVRQDQFKYKLKPIPFIYTSFSLGYEKIIQILIAEGANINAKNKLGDSAVILAASKGIRNQKVVCFDQYSKINWTYWRVAPPTSFYVTVNDCKCLC